MTKYRGILLASALLAAFAAVPALAASKTKAPAADDPSWTECTRAAAELEAELGIPAYLLQSVTLTETGRAGPNRQLASWPWTVHDGTRGHYAPTREAAVELVRDLRDNGRRSIDVGCMQVNLKHHPRAFTSVDEGFDAKVNIRYAAGFLIRLKEQHGSWEEAVARYHSYNPEFYQGYASKVLSTWAREKARALAAGEMPVKTAAAKPSTKAARPLPAAKPSAGPVQIAALETDPGNEPEVTFEEAAAASDASGDESGLMFFRTLGWTR